MICLAARAHDLISHYPDFGDCREANALIGACGCQLLDRQSYRCLDGKTEWPIRMAPAAAIQWAVNERRQPATYDQSVVAKRLGTSHQLPSLLRRAGIKTSPLRDELEFAWFHCTRDGDDDCRVRRNLFATCFQSACSFCIQKNEHARIKPWVSMARCKAGVLRASDRSVHAVSPNREDFSQCSHRIEYTDRVPLKGPGMMRHIQQHRRW
jgi:hypothetical protein